MPDGPVDDLVEAYLAEFFNAVDVEEHSKEEYAALVVLDDLWKRMTSAQHDEIQQAIGFDPPWLRKKETLLS